MQSLHFTAGTSSNGVIERDFTVGEVTGNSLVGRIRRRWRAPGTDVGHGGGQHRTAPAMPDVRPAL